MNLLIVLKEGGSVRVFDAQLRDVTPYKNIISTRLNSLGLRIHCSSHSSRPNIQTTKN